MEWATCVIVCFLTLLKQSSSRERLESGVVTTILPDDPYSEDAHHVYLLDGDPVDIYDRYTSNSPSNQSWHNFGYSNYRQSKLVSCGVNYAKSKLYLMEGNTGRLKLISSYTWEDTFQSIASATSNSGLAASLHTKIAVDWVSGNVYIADPVYRWIVLQSGDIRANSESIHKILIDTQLSRPTAIAVTPIQEFLFWADVGPVVKIERANLAGQQRTTIVSTGLVQPTAITVDLADSMIYWVDIKAHTVARSDYNGGTRHTILRRWREEFTDILVFGDIIMVSEVSTGLPKFISKHTDEVLLDGLDVASIKGTIWGLCHYSQAAQPQPDTNWCLTKSCSDMCINGLNEATCVCREGYRLDENAASCSESLGDYSRALVVAGSGGICLKDIRSVVSDVYQSRVNCVVSGTAITYFDIDMNGRQLIYATERTIYSKAIDSQTTAREIVSTADVITGLVLDWIDNNIYWSMGQESGKIQVLDQKTDSVDTVIGTNLNRPRELLLMPHNSMMVWISGNSANAKIEKANMDGSGRATVLEYPNMTSPVSIAFDQETKQLYWTDSGSIVRCDLDGTNRETLGIWGLLSPQLLITYQNHLIYTEDRFSSTRIMSDDLRDIGNPGSGFSVQDVGQVTGIKVLDSQLQPHEKNPCAETNGGCDQICLPVGGSSTCRCEHGFTLDNDNKTCSSSHVTDNFVFVTDLTHGKLYQVDEDTGNVHGFPTGVASIPRGVVYNYETQQVFWTDNAGLIQRINIDGSGYKVLKAFEDSLPNKLAIDYSTGNLHYTTLRTRLLASQGVGVISPVGESRVLVEDGHEPHDIVLDPEDGYVFWTDVGTVPTVKRANCDGSASSTIIRSNIASPRGLAIDQEGNVLYVTDSTLNTIQRCTYAGQCDVIYTSDNAFLADIALAGPFLYVTAWDKHYITKVNRFSPTESFTLARDSEFGRFDSLDVYRSNEEFHAVSSSCATDNGGCSTFCFPTPDGRVCGCEDGQQLIGNSNTVCDTGPIRTTTGPSLSPVTSDPRASRTTSTSTAPQSSGDLPIAVIAGVSAGAVVLIVAGVLVAVWLVKRRQNIPGGHQSFDNPQFIPESNEVTMRRETHTAHSPDTSSNTYDVLDSDYSPHTRVIAHSATSEENGYISPTSINDGRHQPNMIHHGYPNDRTQPSRPDRTIREDDARKSFDNRGYTLHVQMHNSDGSGPTACMHRSSPTDQAHQQSTNLNPDLYVAFEPQPHQGSNFNLDDAAAGSQPERARNEQLVAGYMDAPEYRGTSVNSLSE